MRPHNELFEVFYTSLIFAPIFQNCRQTISLMTQDAASLCSGHLEDARLIDGMKIIVYKEKKEYL